MPGLFFRVLSFSAILTLVFGDPNSGIGGDSRQLVENHLLTMMGLKRRPRHRNKPVNIPPYMLELFQRQQVEEDEQDKMDESEQNIYGANTIRSFTNYGIEEDSFFTWQPQQFHLRFDVSSIPSEEKLLLQGTELRLFRQSSTVKNNRKRRRRSVPFAELNQTERMEYKKPFLKRISIHDVLKPSKNSNTEPVTIIVDTKLVDVRKSQWEVFDILPAVRRWLKEPSENYGVIVEVTNTDGDLHPLSDKVRLRRSVNDKDSSWSKEQPLLVAFIEDEDARERSRRTAQRRHRIKGQKQNCERQKLYVDFKKVGWQDWIVAPPGYDAYYCHGDCPTPLSDHYNATNHAIVQNIMNSVNPIAAPKACCIPTELSSISMLYLDDTDKVVLKNYKEMVVQSCGCR